MSLRFYKIRLTFFILLLTGVGFAQSQTNVELFYLSNLNAQVQNCFCGTPSYGGLDRLINLIALKRNQNPDCIFIDGGDFLNSYPFATLNQAVVELYQLLKPDVLIPSDQEFVDGLPVAKKIFMQFPQNILWSNAYLPGISTPKKLDFPGVRILGYLDESAFDLIKKPPALMFDLPEFEKLYKQAIGHHVIIVVYHGSRSALDAFIAKYQKIGLVLAGHSQSLETATLTKPYIVGGGFDGERLRQIKLRIVKHAIQSIQVKDIAVGTDIKPNSKAVKIIKKYKIK